MGRAGCSPASEREGFAPYAERPFIRRRSPIRTGREPREELQRERHSFLAHPVLACLVGNPHRRFAIGLVLLLSVSGGQASALRYVVRAVDGVADARAINAQGDVVGVGEPIVVDGLTDGRHHAVLNRGGQIVDLGTLWGEAGYSVATDVNDAGTIVGWATLAPLGQPVHAFGWQAGVMQDLGEVGVFGNLRVNESGVIVATRAGGASIWIDGVWSTLPHLPDGTVSYARDVDAAGRIVGDSNNPGGSYHATRWTDGVPVDLGTLPGDTQTPAWRWSNANATNDAGDVVGHASYGSEYRAFLFRDGVMRDLGTLAGRSEQANAINRHGQIAGTFLTSTGSETHAFIWDEATGMRDLNTLIDHASGWVLEHAAAMNDAGVIVGEGSLGTFVASPDHDDDGVPDETDPCTNVDALRPERLDLVLRPKKLRLRAEVLVVADPAVDPLVHGFRLVLTDSAGGAFVDGTIPGGTGWRGDGANARWRAPAGQAVGGLTRVGFQQRRNTGALRIDVVGSGIAPVPPLPITVAIVIDAPIARTGQCTETAVDTVQCSLARDALLLRCRSREPR